MDIKQRVNEQIRITPILLIGADGQQMGVLPTAEAMTIAREAGLDLVEVSPDARPPVVRIMDYGKYKYDKNKRSHKNASHQLRLKEIRLRPKTGDHDVDVKVDHARKFLELGHKVQITVIYRGRENAHLEEGQRILERVLGRLEDVAKVESPPGRQAKRLTCVVAAR